MTLPTLPGYRGVRQQQTLAAFVMTQLYTDHPTPVHWHITTDGALAGLLGTSDRSEAEAIYLEYTQLLHDPVDHTRGDVMRVSGTYWGVLVSVAVVVREHAGPCERVGEAA